MNRCSKVSEILHSIIPQRYILDGLEGSFGQFSFQEELLQEE
ncbi:hypothetical protein NSE_0639 [Neorickettsia sennetsu str. Miyayama]|uniref:Uncharacterized protein n=1 Tax=Ehrlichia sennetsu (strain ATCC VR-367 / Miyayama) TaxID=222891 RepID=Q2GDC9_EHRS3|nr:hypothetical protein NSE_0639 [Neorickettsia sennetsu str. Miyayama]